jgi:hypothetical protein
MWCTWRASVTSVASVVNQSRCIEQAPNVVEIF